ncbi:ABC transporter permease [Clostridium cylindrosporum]|uniref:ABC-2 family transporter protein n=1 Tax=Clostridium cylindrosporum DSM 605 TaxID=1121307 RepID=A0A0J8D931_CLOCY|nr:ABC transporter permease [Clostridium cylindrosporum]KMT22382.1 ABC-2 family transporter protein [Clostridium cylindrosporum DSM 605]
MTSIAIRNLKIFFRDKSAIFFSLLSALIIIGLYALFLGDAITKDMKGIDNAEILINNWIMAGILAVTSITTTMGAFGTMVNDRSRKILKDFISSPIKRYELVGGYILSSFIIGVIMTFITLIIAEAYIYINDGELLSLVNTLKVIGLIIISVLSSSAMVFFMVSFFQSQNAFATASTVVGTLIGFLTGIYIPIGTLPEAVQFVVKVFPVSHSGALIRQVMMEDALVTSFAGAPSSYIDKFNLDMGVIYKFGDTTVSFTTSIIILIVTAVVFYILAILNMSRKIK